MTRFALRTIRNGKVRIFGHDYAPRTPLLPEHEGMRAAFGLYRGPVGVRFSKTASYDERGLLPFVSLWGSEAAYRADTEEDVQGTWPGPFCDEDGYFRWEWWHRSGDSA